MNTIQLQFAFAQLMAEIANYDNINFPTLRFKHEMCFCSIIYPKGSEINHHAFNVLQKHYNYTSCVEPVKVWYKVATDDNHCITINVELIIK